MTASFHDVRFPDDIAYGALGGPGFATDVVAVAAGIETRNAAWSQARRRWDVAHAAKTRAAMERLTAFFLARSGRAYAFRFRDWTDWRMPRQAISSGDGVTTDFALVKVYGDDAGFETRRPITKPVPETVQVWRDGVADAAGWSVDALTGVIRFAVAPAAGAVIEAACDFDVPVRFDTDVMRVSIDAADGFTWPAIPLIEVKGE